MSSATMVRVLGTWVLFGTLRLQNAQKTVHDAVSFSPSSKNLKMGQWVTESRECRTEVTFKNGILTDIVAECLLIDKMVERFEIS